MAFRINVEVDSARLLLRMNKGEKRFIYAVVNAINKTAKRIQTEERRKVFEDFVIRKPEFIAREAAKIKPFASVRKGQAFAEIFVGQKPRLLLSQYEVGGPRLPIKGKRIAVPIIGQAARPQFPAPVPKEFRFTQMRLRLTPRGTQKRRRPKAKKGKGRVRYGLQGTYLIPEVGVFRRETGDAKSKLIYAFIESQQLPKKLEFIETAKAVADVWFKEEIQRQIFDTLGRHPLPVFERL